MRAILVALSLMPMLSFAQVDQIADAIRNKETYAVSQFEKVKNNDEMLMEWTSNDVWSVCRNDPRCQDSEFKRELALKIIDIQKRTWDFGIQKQAMTLNELHELLKSCSPEAARLFNGEGNSTCAQLVTCEGDPAMQIFGIAKAIGEGDSFTRTPGKDELDFEGIDLSPLIQREYHPLNKGYMSSVTNGVASYTNRKGSQVSDGINTTITSLADPLLTARFISCDRVQKKKTTVSCTIVLSRAKKPQMVYGESKAMFSQTVTAVGESCIEVKKKKK